MSMKLKLVNPYEPGRGDGPNPRHTDDDIEWDMDPHTSKRGTVLKTFEYLGHKAVIIQGSPLWSVVDHPELGKFTSQRDAFRAIDILVEGAKSEAN